MYMYYLLGHRIMDSHLSIEDRQLLADNTYLLAIDGDSKFEPDAVLRLLNLMNTKSDIGCACGRIHPIGNGYLLLFMIILSRRYGLVSEVRICHCTLVPKSG